MDEPTRRGARITSVHARYHDAGLSAYQRQQRVDDVQRRLVALTIDQGVDAEVLASIVAAQTARTRLADTARQSDERHTNIRRRNH
jgi:hypothetical protein